MVKPEDKPRVELHDGSEPLWPQEVKRGIARAAMAGYEEGFSLLCAVGMDHKTHYLSAFFSPRSSANPDLALMCADIAEMFQLMAERLRQ